MRLVSYRESPAAPWRAGIVRGDEIVDAGQAAASIGVTGDVASVREILLLGDRLGELGAAAGSAPAVPRADVEIGPPVPDPPKVLCIGLNYTAHAEETKLDSSAVPTVFAKFANSIIASGEPIVVPAATSAVDYEGELAVVIGRRARRLRRDEALDAIAGVMPLNDVSARDLQFQSPQWTAGKAVDTFAPCGPELVLLDEVADLQDLRLTTRVNDRTVQDASTAQMIFDVAHIVSFLSSFMTLEVGDIIATGTPEGVGFTREPPLLLQPGDRVEVEIDGVGLLSNTVTSE